MDIMEIKFSGEGVSPETLKMGELADVLEDFDK